MDVQMLQPRQDFFFIRILLQFRISTPGRARWVEDVLTHFPGKVLAHKYPLSLYSALSTSAYSLFGKCVVGSII